MSAPAPAARIGVIGAGTIAARYIESLAAAPGFRVEAIASRSGTSARQTAARFGLRATSLEALIADPQLDLMLNLAPAQAHAEVTRACLRAGKHVYSEKPLATSLAQADALIAMADEAGLLLACAPAVMLWPPLRTAAALAHGGALGALVGGFASVIYSGPELFHPNPDHLYARGAGPLFDMGVYGLTALTDILGPAVEVQAMARPGARQRRIQAGPRAGEAFSVETPTTVLAQLRHNSGALSSVQFGFEAMGARAPGLEIYGARASLSLLRPFSPDGEVLICEAPGQWRAVAIEGPAWRAKDWAIGVTSAWRAFHAGAPFAASATRARETLALMCAIESQSVCGKNQAHVQHWEQGARS